jgi:translation initiation factor IF-1
VVFPRIERPWPYPARFFGVGHQKHIICQRGVPAEHLRKAANVARDDNVKVEGTVVKVHSGGMYQVETDDGRSIRTKLSGRMSRFRIKVLLGDRVTVALSPYDLTHGLIVYRGK